MIKLYKGKSKIILKKKHLKKNKNKSSLMKGGKGEKTLSHEERHKAVLLFKWCLVNTRIQGANDK